MSRIAIGGGFKPKYSSEVIESDEENILGNSSEVISPKYIIINKLNIKVDYNVTFNGRRLRELDWKARYGCRLGNLTEKS